MKQAAHLNDFVAKMKKEGLKGDVIETFCHYYRQLVSGETGYLPDQRLRAVPPSDVKNAAFLDELRSAGNKVLGKTVHIVLNGGLGTSMGLTGPKSLINVRDGRSFLEIKLRQAENAGVTLVLMNSYRTAQETRHALSRLSPRHFPETFVQNKFPKILKENLKPADWPPNPELEWNPPGHGDIYSALRSSGLLSKLISSGVTYAFISNCDNLGAYLDKALLGYFATYRFPFMMEVAERTPADVKGGHLARHEKGYLLLRELAQCPKEDIDAFKDIRRYRYFNTNNLWLNLKHLEKLIRAGKPIHLPIILNTKTLDPRDPQSPPVIQIETAMGSAISLFKNPAVVKVDDRRFFPVKKCNELLAVRSDCYLMTDDFRLLPNPARSLGRIRIDLDPAFFGKLDDFETRFANGIPRLVDCRSLKIRGDVSFGTKVRLKGDVNIEAPTGRRTVVPDNTVLEGAVQL